MSNTDMVSTEQKEVESIELRMLDQYLLPTINFCATNCLSELSIVNLIAKPIFANMMIIGGFRFSV